MASADTLPLADLLAPLAGTPCGADLRVGATPGSPYYRVKDARGTARAAERSLENGDPETTPDWAPVAKFALAALQTTRDLELAAYLTEAQLRLAGFAGLRDGFRLLSGLVERFWPDLYPSADEDGVATTLAPITGLNGEDAPGTLIAPVYRTPLAEGVTYAQYLAAAETAKILDPKVRDKRINDGAVTFERLRAEFNQTPASKTRALHDDLVSALSAYRELGQLLTEKAGADAPPTSAVEAALEAVLGAVRDLGREQLAATATVEDAPAATSVDGAPAEVAPGQPGVAAEAAGERMPTIQGRADALRAVQQLADYFRRTEPHSLVPYALEQAVRWARMPLPELLRELIPDEEPRQALFKQVGVPIVPSE